MQVTETPLPGLLIITPDIFTDERGFFLETWHASRYAEAGVHGSFVQDNHSRSSRHTIRGLHWQDRRPQAKLVRVIEGEVYDVAVDLRPESSSFGHWFGLLLSAENFLQSYIPPGFAHGFCVVSDVAQVEYKCTDFYDRQGERGVAWDDPDLAIAWPVTAPLLSPRDAAHPTLRALFGRGPAK
jgi:dTDP-4-dehydrorhamnose 3,5-epimerase